MPKSSKKQPKQELKGDDSSAEARKVRSSSRSSSVKSRSDNVDEMLESGSIKSEPGSTGSVKRRRGRPSKTSSVAGSRASSASSIERGETSSKSSETTPRRRGRPPKTIQSAEKAPKIAQCSDVREHAQKSDVDEKVHAEQSSPKNRRSSTQKIDDSCSKPRQTDERSKGSSVKDWSSIEMEDTEEEGEDEGEKEGEQQKEVKKQGKPRSKVKGPSFCSKCGIKMKYKTHETWCGREDEQVCCLICGNVMKAITLQPHLRTIHQRHKSRITGTYTYKSTEKKQSDDVGDVKSGDLKSVNDDEEVTKTGRTRRKASKRAELSMKCDADISYDDNQAGEAPSSEDEFKGNQNDASSEESDGFESGNASGEEDYRNSWNEDEKGQSRRVRGKQTGLEMEMKEKSKPEYHETTNHKKTVGQNGVDMSEADELIMSANEEINSRATVSVCVLRELNKSWYKIQEKHKVEFKQEREKLENVIEQLKQEKATLEMEKKALEGSVSHQKARVETCIKVNNRLRGERNKLKEQLDSLDKRKTMYLLADSNGLALEKSINVKLPMFKTERPPNLVTTEQLAKFLKTFVPKPDSETIVLIGSQELNDGKVKELLHNFTTLSKELPKRSKIIHIPWQKADESEIVQRISESTRAGVNAALDELYTTIAINKSCDEHTEKDGMQLNEAGVNYLVKELAASLKVSMVENDKTTSGTKTSETPEKSTENKETTTNNQIKIKPDSTVSTDKSKVTTPETATPANKNSMGKSPDIEKTILIERYMAAEIIGHRGVRVTYLQSQTNTKISINKKSQSESYVSIYGSTQGVAQAEGQINEWLRMIKESGKGDLYASIDVDNKYMSRFHGKGGKNKKDIEESHKCTIRYAHESEEVTKVLLYAQDKELGAKGEARIKECVKVFKDIIDKEENSKQQSKPESEARILSNMPCRNFEDGFCQYGDSCWYKHDKQEEQFEHLYNSFVRAGAYVPSAPADNTHNHGDVRKVYQNSDILCATYERDGYCPFGSFCWYRHKTPPVVYGPQMPEAEKRREYPAVRNHNEEAFSNTLCRNYERDGHCPFDESCWYVHDHDYARAKKNHQRRQESNRKRRSMSKGSPENHRDRSPKSPLRKRHCSYTDRYIDY